MGKKKSQRHICQQVSMSRQADCRSPDGSPRRSQRPSNRIDIFFQAYSVSYCDCIVLVLDLGKGAVLTLEDSEERLCLTDHNITTVLTAWNMVKKTDSSVAIRFCGKPRPAHKLSRASTLLLLDNTVDRGREGDTIVIDLGAAFRYKNIVDDAALIDLGSISEVLGSRRIHFTGCNVLKSLDTVERFCRHVFSAMNCVQVRFSFPADTSRTETLFKIPPHILRWFVNHQKRTSVVFEFAGQSGERPRIFSGPELAYYVQFALWDQRTERSTHVERMWNDYLSRFFVFGVSPTTNADVHVACSDRDPITRFGQRRPDLSMRTLSLRHFGLRDTDIDSICQGLKASMRHANFNGRLDISGNAGITERGMLKLLCFAVSASCCVEFIVSPSLVDYQRWFSFVARSNRKHRWLLDAALLICQNGEELVQELFISGKCFHESNSNLDTLFMLLSREPATWATRRIVGNATSRSVCTLRLSHRSSG